MEIEAKFVLPDLATYARLQAIEQLAGFALSAGEAKRVHDTYLDTADDAILTAGYTCRARKRSDGTLITVKSVKRAEGAVHRREEMETELPADARLAEWPGTAYLQWPDSPVRAWLLERIGDKPLARLFELGQTRAVRRVSLGDRPVAELSLDDVRLTLGNREQTYAVVEVELAPQGTEDDLAALVTSLQDEWGLEPDPRSKFERGLAFLARTQAGDGSWRPLWFGSESDDDQANPVYGTSRVVVAACELAARRFDEAGSLAASGAEFLLNAQNDDGGFGAAAASPSTIEGTALALEALAAAGHARAAQAQARAAKWLIERTGHGRSFPPAPIGLYFARLWYYEDLYPVVFTLGALERLCRRSSD